MEAAILPSIRVRVDARDVVLRLGRLNFVDERDQGEEQAGTGQLH